jgi:Holliday junction resolvase-like predicted endonuclease
MKFKKKLESQKRLNIHDDIIKSLEERLQQNNNYDLIKCNVCYGFGECDLLATKTYVDGRKLLLLFEVKSNDKHHRKAIKQLQKNRKQFFTKEFNKCYCFYVEGNKKGGYRILKKNV